MMKLSKREKNLLIFLLAVVVLVGGYFFVVQPLHDARATAQNTFNSIEQQFNVSKTRVKGDDEITSTISDYRDRLDKVYEKLPSQIYLEKIIHDVYTHFAAYDITLQSTAYDLDEQKANSIDTTSDIVDAIMNPRLSVNEILDRYEAGEDVSAFMEEVEEPETAEEAIEDLLNVDVGQMNVLINFQADYMVMKEALNGLKDVDGTIIPMNLTLRKVEYDADTSPNDNSVYASLTIAIPFFFDNEELEDIIFDYQFEPGNGFEEHGPFEYIDIENYIGEVKRSNAVVSNLNPDFEVGVRNTSSDIAAQSMVYRRVGNSIIQLDSNVSETFTLDLTETNDTISFRYLNDVDSYPSNGYATLTPNGNDIIVRVNSTSKANSGDDAGITFVLNNNTSRRVVFYVFNDDPSDPRFKVVVNTGTYQVIRN